MGTPTTATTWHWCTTGASAFTLRHALPASSGLLAPVRARRGRVLELGCGTGLLTKRLVDAGHRVIATDASPAMLALAAETVGDTDVELGRLTLPDDPLPEVDAIVAVGHPLSYLSDAEAIERALAAMATALRPGGIIAFDICDLSWGGERPNLGRRGPDWAIITEYSAPSPDRFVRDMTIFVADGDGRWRRDEEHHENVLMDTSMIPPLLARNGLEAKVTTSFGDETLPEGLHVVIGQRPGR